MKLDLGSFAFGAETITPGGNPSWGTALGQSLPELKLTSPGHECIIEGMLYKSIPTARVFMPVGKGGKVVNGAEDENIQLAAMFEKVYVNEVRINANFILVVYKDSSDSWAGRRTLKYGTKIEYRTQEGQVFSNQDVVPAIEEALQMNDESSWIASDLYVSNQDELHLLIGIVNPNKSETFANSEVRKRKWQEVIQANYESNAQYISRLEGRNIHTNNIKSRKSILPSHSSYLTALQTKPFLLLAGISGTGKSRIVREFAFKSCPEYLQDEDHTTPGNYLMVEVKPNWHDSSELLGYYSNLTNNGKGAYIFTPFVKFLIKAMMFPDVPFFVCLDEMNLAPVEQYFAEFLSVLETRKLTNDGVKSGVLVDKKNFAGTDAERGDGYLARSLYNGGLPCVTSEIYCNFKLRDIGLTLPDNVFIIGTINMDDTTHQFSRKVIDRAMTIEMNGGDLMSMFGGSKDMDYLPAEEQWTLDQFQPRYVTADEALEAHPDVAESIKRDLTAKLDAINLVLENTPFQVSYRVLNELTIYMVVLLENGKSYDDALAEAVDQILLMKILPRVEGDQDLLMVGNESRINQLNQFAISTTTKDKLTEMQLRLERQEFTRFWP